MALSYIRLASFKYNRFFIVIDRWTRRKITTFAGKRIKMTKYETEEKIVEMLKTVYDPEIPVNVYDLGLIYKIDVSDDYDVTIDMTLTAPSCPAGDFIVEDIRQKVGTVKGVRSTTVNVVFEPEWNKDMMNDEAKLELGFM